MKLTPATASYAVIATAFHGGGTLSLHRSLEAAIKSSNQHQVTGCTCGCCAVVPITGAASRAMDAHRDRWGYPVFYNDEPRKLYSDYPADCSGAHYSQLCR